MTHLTYLTVRTFRRLHEQFDDGVFPTGIYTIPSAQRTEIVLITCSDGKYRLASKTSERVIDGHVGAILSAGWSHDASMLATAGEDGTLRLWLRNGSYKSNLGEHETPVTCMSWSPITAELVYSVDQNVYWRSLHGEDKKARTWKAHSATVTTVALSLQGTLVSGGEDCKYKLWDTAGRSLFYGGVTDQPVSSLAWTPDGELFAVASFETLILCHKTGYVISKDYPSCQSISSLCWNDCGTQLAGATSSGKVLLASLVDRTLEWNQYEVSTVGTKLCLATDVNMEKGSSVELTFQGQSAAQLALQFGHLLVSTNQTGGVFVYGAGQWQMPTLIRPTLVSPVKCFRQSGKYLAFADSAAIHVYAYNGKGLCTIRHPFLRANISRIFDINDEIVVLAVQNSIQFFNINTGKQLAPPFTHERSLKELRVEQRSWPESLSGGEHLMSLIDSEDQMHLVCLRGKQAYSLFAESQILSTMWSETARQLCALRDGQLLLWECAWSFNVAAKLMELSKHTIPIADIGPGGSLENFHGSLVSLKQTNGSIFTQAVPLYSEKIEEAIDKSQWDSALKIARFFDTNQTWCTLACVALLGRKLTIARDAFTALGQVDRADYLDKIREQGGQMEGLLVQLLVTGGRARQQVEGQMVQMGKILDAIMLNVHAHQWDRALSLAMKQNAHIDVVLAYRKKYLERFNKIEDEPLFIETNKKFKADDMDYMKIREMVSQQSVVEL
ncbi:intraflagellar transport protein 80 homolog [Galendromus occidentalis]|uniref:Intraflagellar transport protein 80 homolog n=1 Tax=Galendromus occidentalis TaxID=34638 RepID=A0AAJ7L5B4_9ACAR|nr:intraflagellar transport protein 80 homolog [Galendromus occidentalis]